MRSLIRLVTAKRTLFFTYFRSSNSKLCKKKEKDKKKTKQKGKKEKKQEEKQKEDGKDKNGKKSQNGYKIITLKFPTQFQVSFLIFVICPNIYF